jgi:hypothetical protein
MSTSSALPGTAPSRPSNRYRLPGIEREGIAQLSLLETALWTLQGGRLPGGKFETTYTYPTSVGRKPAAVTVRSAIGLQPIDEYVLWGLLGATLSWKEPDPVLLATPYWLLRHLGLETGGSQYHELRKSLLRLATTSYQNTAFYDPETREHEYAAFQFLSILLPTVGGRGETVDTERSWRIEWNPAFFRFCKTTGGNLLFDLDLYRRLTPASRRLFLKLKDRFWRSKRVFMNVAELTVNGLGFSALRPLKKRKFDLKNCLRELLAHRVIELGRGQTNPEELFFRRSKGCYVVVCYEGEYFRAGGAERSSGQKNALADDPLCEPLQRIGVDAPGIRRLLRSHGRGLIQRWLRITEAALHEQPSGFAGFKVSPAAFLIDGVQNYRTPPDWFHAHAKRQERKQWEQVRAAVGSDQRELRELYDAERTVALKAYQDSELGRQQVEQAYQAYLNFYRVTEPLRAEQAARAAAHQRLEKLNFQFPSFEDWERSR